MVTHYILLWVEKPAPDAKADVRQSYMSLMHDIGGLKITGGTSQVIREGVWLLDRESDMHFFSHVVAQASDRGLTAQWRFFAPD